MSDMSQREAMVKAVMDVFMRMTETPEDEVTVRADPDQPGRVICTMPAVVVPMLKPGITRDDLEGEVRQALEPFVGLETL